MVIGIDIDDTTVVTVESMVKYGDIYDEKVFGRKSQKDKLGLIKDRYYMEHYTDGTKKKNLIFLICFIKMY